MFSATESFKLSERESAMTKKDFIMIAAIIKDIGDPTIRKFVALKFNDKLRTTNPLYDRAKFMKACGEDDSSS